MHLFQQGKRCMQSAHGVTWTGPWIAEKDDHTVALQRCHESAKAARDRLYLGIVGMQDFVQIVGRQAFTKWCRADKVTKKYA